MSLKPTNLKDQPCESKSSECVIWDGKDIECVGIKCGDTVTTVVYALGKKLCEMEDLLEVRFGVDYNIAPLEAIYGPIDDFNKLMRVLVARACATLNP